MSVSERELHQELGHLLKAVSGRVPARKGWLLLAALLQPWPDAKEEWWTMLLWLLGSSPDPLRDAMRQHAEEEGTQEGRRLLMDFLRRLKEAEVANADWYGANAIREIEVGFSSHQEAGLDLSPLIDALVGCGSAISTPPLKAAIALLRDVLCGPVPLPEVNPAWLVVQDRLVHRLALAIYEEDAYDQLPILADALEDAGCHDQVILNHCRLVNDHVRGCWLVDLLLGKGGMRDVRHPRFESERGLFEKNNRTQPCGH